MAKRHRGKLELDWVDKGRPTLHHIFGMDFRRRDGNRLPIILTFNIIQ